jgi:glycosyltransferase involved in cell wall biosynthesis
MYNPLVSIVIPTYCQTEYIIRAVESALMQDYGNIEIIVSDDSPTSETELILRPYIENKSIQYIHNQPRLGRVKNYRTCLYEYSKGEWLVNLDGDDYFIDNQFISSAIESINNDKSIVFAIANGTVKQPDGTETIKKIPATASPFKNVTGKTYFKNFSTGRGFFHLTILYNVEKAKAIDFYRKDILSTDIESVLRLALTGNVILLDRNVGVWFLHNNNTSSNADLNEFIKNTGWIDSVVEFGIKSNKLNFFYGKFWNYLVKQQELSGFFMRQLKSKNTLAKQINYLLFVLQKFPITFFFPVFIKKSLQFLVTRK